MVDGLGLGDAYGATLDRIRGQGGEKSRLGMATLMWISHSERPLKANELCHALAVEIGSPNLNTDNVPSIGTSLACCQGLVAVDKETSTVRLIHFTLQEYLRAHPHLFSTAHSTMAETCLSYLNSRQVKALPINPFPDLQDTPFLEYSSIYWGIHAKRDLSDCAKLLALQLFNSHNPHISMRILLKARTWYRFGRNPDTFFLFSGLHCASLFGIVEIVASLVEAEGCDINQKDCAGNTPLVWAAWKGHREVLELLLDHNDVSPDIPGIYGRTPLISAASNGHEGVMKILLERDDVNPEKPDDEGKTPLLSAIENEREGAVKILLRRGDVNPDKPNRKGRTPLWQAAAVGHEGIVKILLQQGDVNPDKPDVRGQTPLFSAARNGHEGVVKMLLGRGDVSPDKPARFGQTPLGSAAGNGHEGVVKILLERDDIDPDKPDNWGETPLCSAARGGHEGVAKILLGRGDVNPNKLGIWDQTPLCSAAVDGHEGVAKILLEREDVDSNKPNGSGRTPLCSAAWGGHEGVVKILLERDDVDPDKPDNFGQTPLSWATQYGYAGVVALLQPKPTTPSTAEDKSSSLVPSNTDNLCAISAGTATTP